MNSWAVSIKKEGKCPTSWKDPAGFIKECYDSMEGRKEREVDGGTGEERTGWGKNMFGMTVSCRWVAKGREERYMGPSIGDMRPIFLPVRR